MMRSRIEAAEDAARQTIDPRQWHWFALRTLPQRERVTRLLLAERGFAAWTPLDCRMVRANRYAKRRIPKRRVVLVGYVLIGLPAWSGGPHPSLSAAMRFASVTHVVSVEGRPARLDPAQVERTMLEMGGAEVRKPEPGARLRLVDGPLDDPFDDSRLLELRAIRGTQAELITRLCGGARLTVPLSRLAEAS